MHQCDELTILAHLRRNARIRLTQLSRATGIPISTIFDQIKTFSTTHLLQKYITLFDFQSIGYATKIIILVRVDPTQKEAIKQYLMKDIHINTLYKINNGYDFLFEAYYRDLAEFEHFFDTLEKKFRIKTKETHYIIEDLCRETFLSDPTLVSLFLKPR